MEEAVCDLGTFVTVLLLQNSPAVLSLRVLCDEMGSSYDRQTGESPSLSKVAEECSVPEGGASVSRMHKHDGELALGAHSSEIRLVTTV